MDIFSQDSQTLLKLERRLKVAINIVEKMASDPLVSQEFRDKTWKKAFKLRTTYNSVSAARLALKDLEQIQ